MLIRSLDNFSEIIIPIIVPTANPAAYASIPYMPSTCCIILTIIDINIATSKKPIIAATLYVNIDDAFF